MKNSIIKWVVDKYIFEDSRIPEEAFDELGIECFEFDYIPFLVEDIEIPYDENDLVVTYTTINSVPHVNKYYGCYYDQLRYNCNVYMSLLEVDDQLFLNHDHMYCDLASLVKSPEFFFELFQKDQLFFRPNKGGKEFTGNVWTVDNISREVDAIIKMYNVELSSMILVSTPKKILEEARFVIGNRKILGSSRYQVNGKHKEDLNVNDESIKLVEDIIQSSEWLPDDLFVIDIAQTPDGPKIIELNSFSCSGWYAIDPKTLISKVSQVVTENYKRDFE